jgi:plasmid stability protein
MPVMLQVRNLPDDVHAKLKQRAVDARMSLSDYVANQLAELVRYRTNAEILEGARLRLAGKSWDETAAESVRAVRAERE